jgi:Caspase domain
MTGRRSALIVANDQYRDPGLRRLRAPVQDARALARVLADPAIGNFDVMVVSNQPEWKLRREVATFFADRRQEDLLLVHLSCHGVKDDSGQLYFATSDTELANLDATAVPADFVNRHMTRSRSRRVVLLLDCCYSGAFARGMMARAGGAVDLEERFEGRGRMVLTASSAMEYAFEDAELSHDGGRPSVFTRTLVQGLETGEADRDRDGRISVDELYEYVYDEVRKLTPKQTPGRWNFEVEGEVLIARSASLRAASLPQELQQAIEHPIAGVRLGAIGELERMLSQRHAGIALAAREALERLAADDSQRVSARARSMLDGHTVAAAPAPPPAFRPAPPRPRQPARPPARRSAPVEPLRTAGRDRPAGAVRTTPAAPAGPLAPSRDARPPRPGSRRLPLLLALLVLAAGGVAAALLVMRPDARGVEVGVPFSTTSPWHLKVHGTGCTATLSSTVYRGTERTVSGANYSLQVRESGNFVVGALTDGCTATAVDGTGGTVDLPTRIEQGVGGDSQPFRSTGAFNVTVSDGGCVTTVHDSTDGSEVADSAGDLTTPVGRAGEFYVQTDSRCTTVVSPG